MAPPPEEEEEDEFGDFPTFEDAVNVPKMVKREEWGALPATSTEPLKLPVHHVRFTYTGTSQCGDYEECVAIIQKIQRDDMEKDGLPDIRYNFLVGGEQAHFFEGRGWNNDASRPSKLDFCKGDCIDIAFIGNFKEEDSVPKTLHSPAYKLVDYGTFKNYIADFPNPDNYPRLFEIACIPYVNYFVREDFVVEDLNIIGMTDEIVVKPETFEP